MVSLSKISAIVMWCLAAIMKQPCNKGGIHLKLLTNSVFLFILKYVDALK